MNALSEYIMLKRMILNAPGAGWKLEYETLITSPKTIHLRGSHPVGPIKPLNISYSKIKNNLSFQTVAMAKVLSERGTGIAVTNQIPNTWSMAREIIKSLPLISPVPDEIELVRNFLANEISPEFELREMLKYSVAVHHAGLSDETRALIEWLAEENKLKVLCATLTIAQGINFPVSSVFLSSRFFNSGTKQVEMKTRDFWNLAGRAGRLQHDSVGVIGLAAGEYPGKKIAKHPGNATLADATGFAPEGVGKALVELNKLEKKLTIMDWMPESLFKRNTGNHLSKLFWDYAAIAANKKTT